MKVKFKKLNEGARLPKRATDGSAAYDLFTPTDIIIKPGRQVIPLGFAMEMELGHEALVDPRSGFSCKGMEGYCVATLWAFGSKGADTVSATELLDGMSCKQYVALEPERFDCDVIEGKIDSDYRKEVGVIVHHRGPDTFLIKAGMRIAQMTFHKVESVQWEETENLSETERDGGFGSTGTQTL